MQINRDDYIIERDYRKKRLEEFQEAIQENLRGLSTEIIAELVDERERQNLTQKDVADITGILPYNLARFETGTRIPTLMVLEKYASALDKHIEIRLCDNFINLLLVNFYIICKKNNIDIKYKTLYEGTFFTSEGCIDWR